MGEGGGVGGGKAILLANAEGYEPIGLKDNFQSILCTLESLFTFLFRLMKDVTKCNILQLCKFKVAC